MRLNQYFLSLRPERSVGKQSRSMECGWGASPPFVGCSHIKINLLRSGDRRNLRVAICGSQSAGRNLRVAIGIGPKTMDRRPVVKTCPPSPVSCPITNYKLGGLTQTMLFEHPAPANKVPVAKRNPWSLLCEGAEAQRSGISYQLWTISCQRVPVTEGFPVCEIGHIAPVRRPSRSAGRDLRVAIGIGPKTGDRGPVEKNLSPVLRLLSPVRLSAISYEVPVAKRNPWSLLCEGVEAQRSGISYQLPATSYLLPTTFFQLWAISSPQIRGGAGERPPQLLCPPG